MTSIEVMRTYLQMTHRSELISAKLEDVRLRIEHVLECPPSFLLSLLIPRSWVSVPLD